MRLFRHEAPEGVGERVLRPTVQRVLRGRFDRQVTTVVAGAGFGKTTALVQAFAENRLAPLGTDRWLACEPDDADAHHLAAGIARSIGVDSEHRIDRLTELIVEACAGLSPVDICLVLDDVHVIPHDSAGAALLDDLIDRMPANMHLVLAGRSRPPVALARLELAGQCADIGEAELALNTSDVEELATRHGVASSSVGEFASHAGWPALVQLSLQHGRPERFVWEEVVRLLDDDQRQVLEALVAIEEADAQTLADVTQIDDVEVLEQIPLVHARAGTFRAHDLWHELLANPTDSGALRRRAAQSLIGRDRYREALDLCVRSVVRGHDDLAAELPAALRGCLVGHEPPSSADLRAWSRHLAPQRSDDPVFDLLDGLVFRLDSPLGAECDASLSRAAAGFMQSSDGHAAVTALSALAFARTIRRDTAKVLETFGDLQQLADAGVGAATPYPLIAETMLATFAEDFPTVLDATERLLALDPPDEAKGVGLMMRANALNKLGHDARGPAEEGLALDLDLPGVRAIWLASMWQTGSIGPFLDAAPDLDLGDRDMYVAGIWFVCVAAAVGDERRATQLLDMVEDRPEEAGSLTQPESLWFAQAAVALLQGRSADARDALLKVVDRFPPDGRAAAAYVRSIPLVYQLVPEMRDYLEAQPDLGALYHRDITLNRAHCRLVELDDRHGLERLDLSMSAGELLPAMGARFAAELVAAAWSQGHAEAAVMVDGLLDQIGEFARQAFRRASEHAHPLIAKGAKSILESRPLAPPDSVRLHLLGGTELSIGDRLVTSPDWRRERVRALLTFLVLHPDTTRENVMAALWPDAETGAARRNFRTTLNVLNALLEPHRVAGDAPFFVRSTGQRLQLVTDVGIDIDVTTFEAELDAARLLVEDGTPSLSIDPLRRAVATYRGDLLPDSYDDWVVFARDRLRSRYVDAAVRCAELLVATGRPTEAIDIVSPLLAIEPWSEPAHRALISAHLENGDLASARRSLASCHAALADFGGPVEEPTHMLERRLLNQSR